MAEKKKESKEPKLTTITDEEKEQVQELQSRYTKVTVNLGQVSLAMERLKANLETLESQREELVAQHNTAQEDEKVLVEKLTESYGTGNLDLDTGIFTPNE